MAGEIVPAVKVIAPDVYEIRGERVVLDAHVAQAFGTETKRVNEAVARNADKFTEAHTFQLSPAEIEALRSQTATSNPAGRGALPAPCLHHEGRGTAGDGAQHQRGPAGD